MLVHEHEPRTGTPSSGTLTVDTARYFGALLRHVRIAAATSSTTFDFAVTDDTGKEILCKTGNTGTYNREFQIPLLGVYTLKVTSASVDELFSIRFASQEDS